MFSRRPSDADKIEQIIPGSRSTYYLVRIGIFLALITFSSLGGWAIFTSGGGKAKRRPVLAMARPVLLLGGDGVELLKKLGGASCTAIEGSSERWVFRIRDHGDGPEHGPCQPFEGDLVVWVNGRTIESFVPVHGESEVVRTQADFEQYQRRYSGAPPRRSRKK